MTLLVTAALPPNFLLSKTAAKDFPVMGARGPPLDSVPGVLSMLWNGWFASDRLALMQ
jgi:hypothetical protein